MAIDEPVTKNEQAREEEQTLPIKREPSADRESLPIVITSRFELENEIERQFGALKQHDSQMGPSSSSMMLAKDDVEMRNESGDPLATGMAVKREQRSDG